MKVAILLLAGAAALCSLPAHTFAQEPAITCGSQNGIPCATLNPCTQGVCLMEECFEAPKPEGAACILSDNGDGASGVCEASVDETGLTCVVAVTETTATPPIENEPENTENNQDATADDQPPGAIPANSPCFVFPSDAACTLIAAAGETPGNDGTDAAGKQCTVRQIDCALQIVCDSGAEVLMGTISGTTLSLVTGGAAVTGTISAAGTLSFNDGRECSPVAPQTQAPAEVTAAPVTPAVTQPAPTQTLTEMSAVITTRAVVTTAPEVFTPPEAAAEAYGAITWNEPRAPDSRQNDVVITVSFLVQGAAVPPLWEVSSYTGFPEVHTSPTGHDVVAALGEYIKRNTVYNDYDFDVVPVHPRGSVAPTVQVMRYSLVKHECRQSDRDVLLPLLMDPVRVQAALSIRSASLGSVQGISIIEVDETPVTKDVSTDAGHAQSKGNIILILVFTIFFLLAAGGVLYYYNYRRAGSEDFDVAPTPMTSSTGGVTETNLTDKRATSMLFRSEAAPSADTFVVSRLPFNITKNKYENHLPYDHTRIELNVSNRAPGSDYINASLVPGHRDATYIAAQAPMARTVQDFWRMIVEQQCTTIVMLTLAHENGIEQSYQYWPHLEGDSQAITFGDVTVTTIGIERLEDTAVRKLSISVAPSPRFMDNRFGGQTFVVTHFLFMGFPEKSTPIDTKPFRSFRQKVFDATMDSSKPTVVHCNNGSGRTGVYICYDMTLARYNDTGEADLFESVVTVRKNRPQMVESKAQYLFLHRAFIDEMRGGQLKVVGTQTQKHVEYLESFAVPPALAPFDIGVAGRKIVEIGELQLVNGKGGRYATATLVILSDLVILSCEQNGEQVMQGFADRLAVAESLFEDVKGADNLCFAVVLDQLYVLAAGDQAIKTDWLRRLKNTSNYVAPAKLDGERMTSFRPTTRSAALAILNCADPQVESGSVALKKEFDTIPRAFNVGPRTVYKIGKQTASRTGVMRNPLGGPKTVNNPLVGAPGGDSSIFFGSPAMLSPNSNYGGSPPGMMDLSIASNYVGSPGQRHPISMGGKVLFPELGIEAAQTSEDVLANKLGELEAAIQRASELQYIASGKGGISQESPKVRKVPEVEPEEYAEPAYLYDDDDDDDEPMSAGDREFNNAMRAALWELFRDSEYSTAKINVEALTSMMNEFGLVSIEGGEEQVKATLKMVGRTIDVEKFEVSFLAQQRLRDGRIRRYSLSGGSKSNVSQVKETRRGSMTGNDRRGSATTLSTSPAHLVRRASRDITQDLAGSSFALNLRGTIPDAESTETETDIPFPASPERSTRRPSVTETSTPFKLVKKKASGNNGSLSRNDLEGGSGSGHGQVFSDHHIDNVLNKRGVSIPALAIKSLHAARKQDGYAEVDSFFTIHTGAKKRMTRNPTLRAKKHYKERTAGRDVKDCTFLANCTCAPCIE